MSEEVKPATETTPAAEPGVDDRFVKMSAFIQTVGSEFREKCFQAIEKRDLDEAVDLFEHIKNLESLYMLSFRTGMKLVEDKRAGEQQAAAEKRAAELGISAPPAPAPAPKSKWKFWE